MISEEEVVVHRERERKGGGRERGEGGRVSTVSCSRFLRKLSAQSKLGSCKGRDGKIECLFVRLEGRGEELGVNPARCASGTSLPNLIRTRFNALWTHKRVLHLIGAVIVA